MSKPLYLYELAWTLEREAGGDVEPQEVTVDYDVDSYGSSPSGMSGPPEHYDPGSAVELIIDEWAWAADGKRRILLTADELVAIDTYLLENPNLYEPSEPDYD